MSVVFDWTITLGQMVHAAILIYCVWLMHRQAQRRLKVLDLKLDSLLQHFGLIFNHKEGISTSNTPSPLETS